MSKSQPSSVASAEIIILPKQLRMDWVDVMALDSRLSHTAFRVACAIGYHFGSRTGSTFVKQDTVAQVLGLSPRTVWSAVAELERLGYLLVKRQEHATISRTTRSGETINVRVAGGKGVANSYLPAVDTSQLTATNRGANLAARCEVTWSQRSQSTAPNLATSCDPTLTSPSGKNPYARGRAREGAPPGASAEAVPVEWITDDDPLWPSLVERTVQAVGRRPLVLTSKWHPGRGYAFRAQLVAEVRAALRPMLATG